MREINITLFELGIIVSFVLALLKYTGVVYISTFFILLPILIPIALLFVAIFLIGLYLILICLISNSDDVSENGS